MLDPRDRKSWHGLFELLQPPAGYRLSAALGTSFGLSLDALVAALLAMGEADPETLASEPVAGVMASTRLRAKVRVLVHPGTISGSSQAGSNRFVALLDRMIVEVDPRSGLFHPKVWALRFDKVGHSRPSDPASRGRLVVSSRNLAPSSSFELGTILEGQPVATGGKATPFSSDVADALAAWLKAAQVTVPAEVRQLPAFIRGLALDVPPEARDRLRLRWQGPGQTPLATSLQSRLKRVLVVSPFVQPDFLAALVPRTAHLQLISTRETLDGLDDHTIARLQDLGRAQKTPAIYHVTELGDSDEGYIDSVHAKLVLTEEDDGTSTTFVGSANATGPGWGLGGPANVEAVVEMRPGISIDAFVAAFIRESKSKVHPWIAEYDRSTRTEPDTEIETERRLLRLLREAATLDFRLDYDAAAQRLGLSVASTRRASWQPESGCEFAVTPLLLSDQDAWTPLLDLVSTPSEFNGVSIEKVTSFVAIRARSKHPPLERTRLALATLHMSEEALDQRDDAVRREIMATADPAAVLSALVHGLSHLRIDPTTHDPAQRGAGHAIRHVLAQASLERLLQAVALQPDLVEEMRLLLGSVDGPLRHLCDDLERVVRQVRDEVAS